MSDPAVSTKETDLRECNSCRCLVVHSKWLHLSGATSWHADPHPGPCLQPCLGGGLRTKETRDLLKTGDVHQRNNCKLCKLPQPILRGHACQLCKGPVPNEARYITRHTEAACALCAMQTLAVRISDVPELLQLVDSVMRELDGYLDPTLELDRERARLREILGR